MPSLPCTWDSELLSARSRRSLRCDLGSQGGDQPSLAPPSAEEAGDRVGRAEQVPSGLLLGHGVTTYVGHSLKPGLPERGVGRPRKPTLGRKVSFWRLRLRVGSGGKARRAAAVHTGVPKPPATKSSDRPCHVPSRSFEDSRWRLLPLQTRPSTRRQPRAAVNVPLPGPLAVVRASVGPRLPVY